MSTEPWALFGAVVAAHALGVASPGPDFAMVLRQTLAHGRRTGVLTALGIGSGILVHVGWGLFGLSWALDRLPGLLDGLRFGGAAFLLWMGLRALCSSPPRAAAAEPPAVPAARAYAVGLATNLLNAKAALFFVALCTSVVTAGASTALKLAMGLWLALATAAWFSFVAVSVSLPAVRLRLARYAHRLDQAMGAVLIALALGIVLSSLSA